MEFVTWEAKYMVGIPVVDQQHQRLVDLTNRLFAACQEGAGAGLHSQFKSVIREAVDYVKVHFRDEESLQLQVQYPAAREHKFLHDDFVRKILDSVRDYNEGRAFVPNNFVRFLRDWLLEHIAIYDQDFGKFYTARR